MCAVELSALSGRTGMRTLLGARERQWPFRRWQWLPSGENPRGYSHATSAPTARMGRAAWPPARGGRTSVIGIRPQPSHPSFGVKAGRGIATGRRGQHRFCGAERAGQALAGTIRSCAPAPRIHVKLTCAWVSVTPPNARWVGSTSFPIRRLGRRWGSPLTAHGLMTPTGNAIVPVRRGTVFLWEFHVTDPHQQLHACPASARAHGPTSRSGDGAGVAV